MSPTKNEQRQWRSSLFRHLDGIVTAPSAHALQAHGVTDYLLTNGSASLQTLTGEFKANDGYLNVALRVLCSQGWLTRSEQDHELHYELTDHGRVAFQHLHLYDDAAHLLKFSKAYHTRKFELAPFLELEKMFQKFKDGYGVAPTVNELEQEVQEQILAHIEGVILGPTLVHLAMSGMFHKYFMQAKFKPGEFHTDAKSFGRLLDILVHFGLFEGKENTYRFTEKGLFFAKRASAYGVTVSYIPTLRELDQLLFGDAKAAKESRQGPTEGHVDRAMNVWGSGGAHFSYFKVVDEVIIGLFNRPIEQQPKGILDMGCGNGAFLTHLFNVVEQQTLRGTMLEEHPLILIGADYNEAALNITRENLVQADIWAKVVFGDIGRPDLLAKDLIDDYGVDIKDVLNVRSFLDHNRIWKEPTVDRTPTGLATGAYAFEGRRISNKLVEASLLEHFSNWAPYVSRFGLLIIELHTVAPELVAASVGRTAATAYDATHGYSDQYIVEVEVFHRVLAEAGLHPDPAVFRKFPDSELATVTVNLLKAR